MQNLVSRPCIATHLVRCQHARFISVDASTTATGAVELPETTSSELTSLHPSNDSESVPTPKPAIKPRIATTWGNIHIPSRETLLQNANVQSPYPVTDTSRSFQPNLTYLTAGKNVKGEFTGSLAQKLALAKGTPTSSDKYPPTTLSTPQTPSQFNPTWILERQQRDRPAESRVRKQVQKGHWGAKGPREDHASHEDQRRPRERGGFPQSHKNREAVPYPSIARADTRRFVGTHDPSQRYNRPFERGQQFNRDQAPRRGSFQGMSPRGRRNGGGIRPSERARLVSKEQTLKPLLGTLEEADKDENAVDDDWDPDETPPLPPNPSGRKDADMQRIDLGKVLGPFSTSLRLVNSFRDPESNQAGFAHLRGRIQWVKEDIGGDYSRYAPQSSDVYVEGHEKLGPVKHAQLMLARRRDVSLPQRAIVSKIIKSSVGDDVHT